MKICTIYDSTAQVYENPITVRTIGEMERALVQLNQNDKEHKFVKYAPELSLYEVGEFDERSGEFTIHPKPIQISNLTKYN